MAERRWQVTFDFVDWEHDGEQRTESELKTMVMALNRVADRLSVENIILSEVPYGA